ncbi:MAG: RelA/SpoT family protein [Bacteroidales bacterium]|nr:RelA/SpoT family protein [Bacteroidales bacterium]
MSIDDTTVQEQEELARKQVLDLIAQCPRCHQNEEEVQMIRKAFELANDAHRGMKRKSGELYIFHPVAVARVAAFEIGLGAKSVTAALLHDVVEDTDITLGDLESLFGSKVAAIVDGLTKLEGVFDQSASLQAENFRKLLVSMIEDVRVILVKLADRLHNMRTLSSMPEHKRYKIAAETLYIYAPIAHRLGLFNIKSELEDLSLKYEHPMEYEEIVKKLQDSAVSYQNVIDCVSAPIKERLNMQGYEYTLKARPKSIYSIWRKMQTKNVPFEEIYDIFAMRIIFKPHEGLSEKAQCWNIYSIITDLYQPKPDRLRDWVSMPKANGYEALHTTVMSPGGRWVEVQIRTERMNDIAERGFAAHWKYKEDGKESEIDNWLKSVRDMLETAESDSMEFLDSVKLNLFSQEMMIFTPKGEVKVMPVGATALDFAFEIHSKLGYHCIGAKVNYKLEPLSHELKSGDQVEIITSDRQTPKYEWMNFVTTVKAKTCIKEIFREERHEFIVKGEQVLTDELQKRKLSINARILKKLMRTYHVTTREELYYQIGKGTVKLDNIEKSLTQKSTSKWVKMWRLTFGGNQEDEFEEDDDIDSISVPKSKKIVLSDEAEKQYTIASCCNPIPGDDVVAFLDDDNSIVLHSRRCPECIKLMSSRGDRIVSAQWESHKVLSYLVVIELSGIDRQGLVSEVTKIISMEQKVNMRSVHFESHDGVFSGSIYLYIYDTVDLQTLIDKLMQVKGVYKVVRKERNDNN